MIRVRSRMIRAGPDGPGGGPNDPETRLVEAQGRMSGWRTGRPGSDEDMTTLDMTKNIAYMHIC